MRRYQPLTDQEYDLCMKIATITKMDCWFSIENYKDGEYVHDLENGCYVPLWYGIGQLFDGIDYALREDELTKDEFATLIVLANKLSLPIPQLI